ncbi:cell division protein ZapE [Acidihalobacter ferrooxydans]|uniref:Cell division protein ZapE n=1 Tax=Acidihalobacter ferrooxydans TaxID=1765967 RepID=A0A1P8UD70_9GAMM|nr:cell division protein ZapE [Acidihalobacter ferrooxydans]APZ41734.1 cell division protein ZapE [Acidihalobacter ferrooxydans]
MADDSSPALTPSARYAAGVAQGRWQADPAQQAALRELDRTFAQLLEAPPHPQRTWRRLWRPQPRVAPRGVYLWGGVGRGKTLLLDLFAAALPTGVALRLHFHHFMRDVHARMRELGPQPDPLPRVADAIAAQARVLCLDEFLVQDIGDAMILAGLLDALFARGIALVTTSNTPPQALYHEGLQRARFLPAIALLERHCTVWKLDATQDWRLRAQPQMPLYLTPPGAAADAHLSELFVAHARGAMIKGGCVALNGREIPVRWQAEGVIWFDFAALCAGPRAPIDYIELANRYPTALLSDVPRMSAAQDAPAKRFVHLIDEFYDRNIKLALSAQVPVEALYAGTRLRSEFARTVSRLVEMQGADYQTRERRG